MMMPQVLGGAPAMMPGGMYAPAAMAMPQPAAPTGPVAGLRQKAPGTKFQAAPKSAPKAAPKAASKQVRSDQRAATSVTTASQPQVGSRPPCPQAVFVDLSCLREKK